MSATNDDNDPRPEYDFTGGVRGKFAARWAGRIISDPKICAGVPTFCGTRVLLETVLASLAAGVPAKELLADFPSLTEADIEAAIAFAAASALDQLSAIRPAEID